jgi:beta-glucanase (GH16 family)
MNSSVFLSAASSLFRVASRNRHASWVRFFAAAIVVCLALVSAGTAQTWGNPVWSDEFNGAANSQIDPTIWQYDTGILNVNNEVEYYCAPGSNTAPCDAGNPNAFIDGFGHLAIQAFRITSSGVPYSSSWTSARLNTGNSLKSFQYGRLESSMSLPVGAGLWPAYWALGTNIDSVGWPATGEIDFMENVPASGGLGPKAIASTLHGGVSSTNCYCGGNGLSKHFTFPNAEDVTTFHAYGAIWSTNMVQFYVDDPTNIFFVQTASDVPSGLTWDFNHPFFVLLNLAVGGTGSFPGPPDSGTPSPATMLVDYVRAYTPSAVAGPTMNGPAITVTAGQTGTSAVSLSSVAGSGRVYLTCTTTAPKANCSVNSGDALNAYTVDFSHSATGSAMVSVTTTANTAASIFPTAGSWLLPLFLLGTATLAFIVCAGHPRRPGYRLRPQLATAGLIFTAALLASCGGSGSGTSGGTPPDNGTPSGTYSVTVSAYTVSNSSGTPDSTGTISLTVN